MYEQTEEARSGKGSKVLSEKEISKVLITFIYPLHALLLYLLLFPNSALPSFSFLPPYSPRSPLVDMCVCCDN